MAITNVVNANGTTPLAVGQGGTSVTSLTTFALLKGDAAGHVSSLTAGTDGQLPIGSTGSDPVMATLTAGSGISITNGAGSITIDTDITALDLPATNAALTEGVININSVPMLSFFDGGGGPNVFIGSGSGNGTLSGGSNFCLGDNCLSSLVAGGNNIAIGTQALLANDEGSGNVAIGTNAAAALNTNTANNNTAIGNSSLSSVGTGSDNIAIGNNSGSALTTTDGSNICIGSSGVIGDNNTIRIGTQGSSTGEQDSCFIAGIAGVTVANSAAVLIDTTTGELGTVVSSLRFKHKVLDMGEESSSVMKLRPVTFAYKQDATNAMQYGLIAEEAAEVMPHLVTYDAFGQPYTIRYHDLPSILLNELQKLSKRVAELEAKLADKE